MATRQPQVGKHDWLNDGGDDLHCLYLENHTTCDQEVETIAAFEFQIAVGKWDGLLVFEWDLAHGEFTGETFFIDRLEQSRADLAVYGNRRSDN